MHSAFALPIQANIFLPRVNYFRFMLVVLDVQAIQYSAIHRVNIAAKRATIRMTEVTKWR